MIQTARRGPELRLMRWSRASLAVPVAAKGAVLATHTRMQRPGVPLPGQLTARDFLDVAWRRRFGCLEPGGRHAATR